MTNINNKIQPIYDKFVEDIQTDIEYYRSIKKNIEPNISISWSKTKNPDSYKNLCVNTTTADLSINKILIKAELEKISVWDFDKKINFQNLKFKSNAVNDIMRLSKNLLPPAFAICETDKGIHYLCKPIKNLNYQFKEFKDVKTYEYDREPLYRYNSNENNFLIKLRKQFSFNELKVKIEKPSLYHLFQDVKYHQIAIQKNHWAEFLTSKGDPKAREYKTINKNCDYENYINIWNLLAEKTEKMLKDIEYQTSIKYSALELNRTETIVDFK